MDIIGITAFGGKQVYTYAALHVYRSKYAAHAVTLPLIYTQYVNVFLYITLFRKSHS